MATNESEHWHIRFRQATRRIKELEAENRALREQLAAVDRNLEQQSRNAEQKEGLV